MSRNKQTIERYIDGFNKLDHEQILSCLTEDVEWIIPGFFHINGKEAFDKEIENDAFEDHPVVAIDRFVEENDIVVAEGTVKAKKRNNGFVNVVFCDVFSMRNGKIKQLISYLITQE